MNDEIKKIVKTDKLGTKPNQNKMNLFFPKITCQPNFSRSKWHLGKFCLPNIWHRLNKNLFFPPDWHLSGFPSIVISIRRVQTRVSCFWPKICCQKLHLLQSAFLRCLDWANGPIEWILINFFPRTEKRQWISSFLMRHRELHFFCTDNIETG